MPLALRSHETRYGSRWQILCGELIVGGTWEFRPPVGRSPTPWTWHLHLEISSPAASGGYAETRDGALEQAQVAFDENLTLAGLTYGQGPRPALRLRAHGAWHSEIYAVHCGTIDIGTILNHASQRFRGHKQTWSWRLNFVHEGPLSFGGNAESLDAAKTTFSHQFGRLLALAGLCGA